MQIDGVVTPPGMFAARKSWTLVSVASGFWMVHVSWVIPGEPTQGPTPWSGVDGDDLTSVAADRRGRFIPWGSVRAVRLRLRSTRSGGPYPVARLRTGVRIRRLEFHSVDMDAVEVFFEPVGRLIS